MQRGGDDGKQRAFGPPHGGGHEASEGGDEADDRKRERILRTQQRPQPDPDRYFGRGRLEDLKREIVACDANLVACDDELAPR